MEIKETDPALTKVTTAVATINDLPNEVLVMVFHRISFKDRIQASLVCNRWDEVIFTFFEARIVLDRCPLDNFHTIRSYKHVGIWSVRYLHEQFGQSLEDATEAVAGGVRSLDLGIDGLDTRMLATILRKFDTIRELDLAFDWYTATSGQEVQLAPLSNLEKLTLEPYFYEGSRHSGITKFVMDLKQMLETNTMLRHLEMDCRMCPEFVHLLGACAYRLLSLHISIYKLMIEMFCTLNFATLKVLVLQVGDGLDPEIISSVYSIVSLEDLTMDTTCPIPVDGIWRLSKLQKFKTYETFMFHPEILKSMPHVRHLAVDLYSIHCITYLKEIFPDIKLLDCWFCDCPEIFFPAVASAWPSLENLSIKFGWTLQTLQTLQDLQKLTRLHKFELTQVLQETNLSILNTVLAIPSLRELRVDGKWVGEVSDINRLCRVFVNDEFIVR